MDANIETLSNHDISAKQLASKFSTKMEIWRFLATEVGVYLPPYPTITIWALKDIVAGEKKVSAIA